MNFKESNTPDLFKVSTYINKYQYLLKEDANNELWITSSNDSVLESYALYNHSIYVLRDFLSVIDVLPNDRKGKLHLIDYNIEDKALQKQLHNNILRFANKYGLLGIYEDLAKTKTEFFIDKNRKPFIYGLNNEDAFLNNRLQNTITSNNEKGSFIDNSVSELIKAEAFYTNTNNSPKQSEPVKIFLDALEMIYRHRIYWNEYNENKMKPDDIFFPIFDEPILKTTTWSEYLMTFGFSKYDIQSYITNFTINLDHDYIWKIAYKCNNLYNVIFLLYINDLVSQFQSMVFCKNCGLVFIRKKATKVFCTESCANCYRVRKHRAKNNNRENHN